MDFYDTFLDETHRALRATCRKFAEREIAPHAVEWEEAGSFPRELYRKAAEAGFLGTAFPEEVGGAGGTPLHALMMVEGLMRGGSTGVVASLTSLGIALPAVVQSGDAALIERVARPVLRGERIAALAITEPGTGSDVAGVRTRAVRDGDDYVVNGSKTFISNGQIADLFVVAVRTDPRASRSRGISLLVIEADRPGFQRGRNLEKIGFHAQDTSELFFDDCRVPASNLLGVENAGFGYLMESLQQERLVLAAGACAAAEGCLALTVDYVKQRRAFGKALGELQHVRFELAELATKVQLARTFLDELFLRHMAGEHLVREVSMAKWWITDVQFEVADRCLQLFGGYGYMTEYPVSRHFVDARIQRIYGGANEIMKELIARQIGLDD